MFDKIAMMEAIENRLLKMVKHPKHDMYLLSYTKSTVAGHVWTPETLAARSLVVDSDFNVVSPCIPKFFNDFDQAKELKRIGYDAYEKLDGSLISLFIEEGSGELIIRSKSVWESELVDQVRVFTDRMNVAAHMAEGYTYICEWIHPLNRHIVDYGPTIELTLLTVINNDDPSYQLAPEEVDWPFGKAKKIENLSYTDVAQLKKRVPEGEEGWVLWNRETNLRTKIKSAEYLQLHRVKFNLNPKAMLELIKEGDDEKIQRMKDTIINLDEQTASMLQSMYNEMVTSIYDLYHGIHEVYQRCEHIQDRKEFAQEVLKAGHPVAGGCFILRDGRELEDYLYRAVDLNAYNKRIEEGYSIG